MKSLLHSTYVQQFGKQQQGWQLLERRTYHLTEAKIHHKDFTRNDICCSFTCHSFSMTGIQCLIDFVKQVERCWVTFLDGEDERESNQRFLASRELLHVPHLWWLARERDLQRTKQHMPAMKRKYGQNKSWELVQNCSTDNRQMHQRQSEFQ